MLSFVATRVDCQQVFQRLPEAPGDIAVEGREGSGRFLLVCLLFSGRPNRRAHTRTGAGRQTGLSQIK